MTTGIVDFLRRDQRGFTLMEVLIAIGLLTVGVVGVGAALTMQGGVSGGADVGVAAVTRGNYYSTAAMLAQARIEEVRNAQYSGALSPPGTDQVTAGNFPNDAYGTIAGYPTFRRVVTITGGTPSAGTKTVTVAVFFKLPAAPNPAQEESVFLTTIVGQRP